jgi:uncharacterized C2H2 Zn-finger protein
MGDNIGTYDTPNKRQRVGYNGAGVNLRMCPHCGRTFKRTEHLERHVRTRESCYLIEDRVADVM